MCQSLVEGDALGHVILQHPLDEVEELVVLLASGGHVFPEWFAMLSDVSS